MTIDFNLLQNIDKNRWECENCRSSIDISWIIRDITEECKTNKEYYDALMKAEDNFDHRECDTCGHSIWFYDEEVKELQDFIRKHKQF